MARKNHTPENTEKGNHKKFSWWKKVVTAFALASSLSACDMPNNEVRLNPENQSAEFKVEYQYYRWASDIEIVDYYVTVHKEWDTYVGVINEKNGWTGEEITVESDNVDVVFDQISTKLEKENITNETSERKNAKINFVRNEYKNKVLNPENTSQTWEIKLKYKPE